VEIPVFVDLRVIDDPLAAHPLRQNVLLLPGRITPEFSPA